MLRSRRPHSLIVAATVVAAVALLAAALPLRAQPQPATSSDGWVVLPLEEYKTLRDKANPRAPEPPTPPVEATLSRIEYDLKADSDSAAGEARLTIDVFKEGWVSVGLPLGLRVQSARLEGRPVALAEAGKSGGPTRLLLSKVGRVTLRLEVALPITSNSGSGESLTLPPSSAATTSVTLVVPRSEVDLSVTGGLLTERSESGNTTRAVAHVTPGSTLSLSWRRKRDEARAVLPTRLKGSLTHLVGLGEEGVQATVTTTVEVTQGRATLVRLAVPDGFVVNQVTGATVADWELKGPDLAVSFLEPLETSATFVISGEARAPREGLIVVPLLRLSEAERETGGVAVEVVGAGELRGREVRGLEAAEAVDLGEAVAGRDSPSLVAYRFRAADGRAPRALSVDVARYTPQAVLMANVEEARYEALLTEEGKTLVQAQYAVRNNQRSFLKVLLPEGATLWSAVVSRRPLRPGRTEDGGLLLPLEKGRTGEEAPAFLVEVIYLQKGLAWPAEGQARLALPVLDLGISRTGLLVHHPPRFRARAVVGGPFRTEDFSGPTSEAFRASRSEGTAAPNAPPPPPPAPRQKAATPSQVQQKAEEEDQAILEIQGLVERFQKEAGQGARLVRTLPVRPAFPSFGPTLFLVSELTPEGAASAVDLDVKQTATW